MSINNFLTKENISTIWEVISDEEMFNFLSRDKQSKVVQIFEINLNTFFNTEKSKSANLMDLNKKYILLILKYIKDTFPQQPSKIKIHNESVSDIENKNNKTLITYEEIQNERVSQFDRDLNKRQMEFDNAIKVKPPPVPEFGDKFEDKPITDMEKIIKEMTEKRNYEVSTIPKSQSSDNSNTWLKPQETSIQNEKLNKAILNNIQSDNSKNNATGNRLKYIKIENDEVSLTPTSKKNVTWNQNLTSEEPSFELPNIFNKLKKAETANIEPTNVELSNNNRIQVLEEEVKNLNTKIDKILELLNSNKI
jgi:hypothetical protein